MRIPPKEAINRCGTRLGQVQEEAEEEEGPQGPEAEASGQEEAAHITLITLITHVCQGGQMKRGRNYENLSIFMSFFESIVMFNDVQWFFRSIHVHSMPFRLDAKEIPAELDPQEDQSDLSGSDGPSDLLDGRSEGRP